MQNTNLLKAVLFLALAAIATAVHRPLKQGCPKPTDVSPCICTSGQFTLLACSHVDNADVLRNVFRNSRGYAFQEVRIQFSVLQYLPHEIFENKHVKTLTLRNTTLIQLFYQPAQFLEDLDTLNLVHTKIMRNDVWKSLEPLKHLRILNVYGTSIKTLNADFSKYVTKELQQFNFSGAAIKAIKPGTLVDFVRLKKVRFDNCKLTSLTRDIFPNPFNVRELYFNQNELETVPDDLFSNMPELETVSLRNNRLAVIPATSFQGSFSNIESLLLDGNPIICDCKLWWLISNKPWTLSGKCESPLKFHGKDIKDLDVTSFHC